MSPAPDPPMILLALPGLMMIAIGAGLAFGARFLVALQVRLLEWQLELIKGGAGVILMRVLGGFFVVCGLAIFVLIATAPSK